MQLASLPPSAPTTLLHRTAATLALLITMAIALAGLTQPAHAAPPKAYNKAGVSFQHPADWKVALDEVEPNGAGMRSIDLEGPEDASIHLMLIPFMTGQNIETLATRAAEHRAEMDKGQAALEGPDKITPTGMTSSTITRRVGGKDIKGVLQRFGYVSEGVAIQLESRFFAIDAGNGSSVNIMTQSLAEDAKLMETALGRVMDTLRYRAKR
ncbi:hypothetical protein PMI14_06120 [Acidovorax sp. CF316]|uniref:hypothetical protein n=1 Tax=Acidovorax sp. CF316 TaxID=1144317 RepID=UPI00026BE587|nr:hypothetical protein [Acidovorax sp. CF316]EJE49322.1 hypothetical protein PMI14_06120 [Acidovorax sp. CF316]